MGAKPLTNDTLGRYILSQMNKAEIDRVGTQKHLLACVKAQINIRAHTPPRTHIKE